MLAEACFVWNRALALQKRYYRLYGKYIEVNRMQKHFSRYVERKWLYARTVQELLQRQDLAYKYFFRGKSKRPPKFIKTKNFTSIVFKQCGYVFNDNILYLNNINKSFKFYKSRELDGNFKRVAIKRNKLGEYFVCVFLDKEVERYGKSRKGASVGIDFGLKTYLTLSDGLTIDNPQYLKESLTELRRRSRNLSKCKKGSNNSERKRKELDRLYNDIVNKRSDFQWKLAHYLCRMYDTICIEDLNLSGMCRRWGRKMADQAHAEFVSKLEHVATKYGVVVHKIDRYYPSSKTCTCGYINKDLKLTDRVWTCPHCGTTHDRDLLAANNILRRGIYELESDSKTKKHSADGQSRLHPTITRVTA
jgi:putative transposase